jgi:hypothetical protein
VNQEKRPTKAAKASSKSSSKGNPKSDSGSSSGKVHFVFTDIDIIVAWLEDEDNFDKIHGSSGKTEVGQPVKRQIYGYNELAGHYNALCKGRLHLNGKAMKERFGRHYSHYLKVREESRRTGFGVTDTDRIKGIFKIERKLEDMCHCFSRMEELFGNRPNITPLVEHSSTDIEPVLEHSISDILEDEFAADFEEFSAELDSESSVAEQEKRGIGEAMQPIDGEVFVDESEVDAENGSKVVTKSKAKDPRKAPPRLNTGAAPPKGNPQLEFLVKANAGRQQGK